MLTPVFLNIIKEIGDDTTHEMTLLAMRTFFFIAARGCCIQRDVEEYLQVSGATASRNVSYWTDRKFDRSEGFGFIQRVENVYDRRQRDLSLTKKGKVFYAKFQGMMEIKK